MAYNINEPDMWFAKTVDERGADGVPRLKMLPGQKISVIETGKEVKWEDIDPSINVAVPHEPRRNNPIGTIFVVRTLTKTLTSKGVVFYAVPDMKVYVLEKAGTADIQNAWKAYNEAMKSGEKAEVPTTPKVLKESLVDKIRKDHPVPTIDKDGFYVDPDIWMSLMINIFKGYNTMLTGSSGTGKTELTQFVGDTLKKKVNIFDMAAKQDPIASLIGVHRFDEKSIFDRADFTFAIEEEGIVVLDELPRAPANTNNILFPLLDRRRELRMDIAAHGQRNIKVNDKCIFIATANEGFEYTGNNVLDRALKERFQIINIPFLTKENEAKLLMKRIGIGKTEAGVICKIAEMIRQAAAKDEVSVAVSTRHTLYAADLVEAGMTLPKAMELAFLPVFREEGEIKRVKDILISR